MKNELKTDNFSKKTVIFHTCVTLGVTIALVIVFGKLAPIALATYRLGHHIIKPFFG